MFFFLELPRYTRTSPQIAHLDGGSGKVRQLLDVLTLFSNDGSHGERRDEEVHRLRLLGSLLDTSTLVSVQDARVEAQIPTESAAVSGYDGTHGLCSQKERLLGRHQPDVHKVLLPISLRCDAFNQG